MIGWILGFRARVWGALYIGSIFVFAFLYAFAFDMEFQYSTSNRDGSVRDRLKLVFVEFGNEVENNLSELEEEPRKVSFESAILMSSRPSYSVEARSEEAVSFLLMYSLLKGVGNSSGRKVYTRLGRFVVRADFVLDGEGEITQLYADLKPESFAEFNKIGFDDYGSHSVDLKALEQAVFRLSYVVPQGAYWIPQSLPFREVSGLIPEGWDSLPTMIYFSAVTTTTLGFGDIVPITTVARMTVAVQTIMGLVLVGLFLNAIAQARNGNGS